MKPQSLLIYFLVLTVLTASMCKKKPVDPIDQLPPETQTGANTFGCLLNGVAWIPNDNYGQATFKLDVDPTLGNGVFGVSSIRYEGNGNGIFFGFGFGSIACTKAGTYYLSQQDVNFSITDTKLLCSYDSNTPGIYKNGSFTITRYDLTNRIFSGTFDFTIYYKGCGDTLHFTNGRFDKKL